MNFKQSLSLKVDLMIAKNWLRGFPTTSTVSSRLHCFFKKITHLQVEAKRAWFIF